VTTYLVQGPDFEYHIADQRYAMIDPSRIAIHPKNPKEHDIGSIIESIGKNKFAGAVFLLEEPLVLFDVPLPEDKDHWCIAGAGRVESALQLSAKLIPALIGKMDADTAESLLLADNEAARRAGYNEQKLLDALTSRIAKYEGDVVAGLHGTLFDGSHVDDLIESLKSAEAAAVQKQTPFAQFHTSAGALDPNKFVAFHFGDHHGHVSREVYDHFVATAKQLRAGGATTNASGSAMMDDILRAWLTI